jgi:hypothetical protein
MVTTETKCNQTNCDKGSDFRFTWPGKDEAGICKEHAQKLEAVARAMGLYLQVIALLPFEEKI